MKQQYRALRISTLASISTAFSIMIPLLATMTVVPDDAIADSSNKKNGTQKLGKQMGSFMNSFMEGLEEQNGTKQNGELNPKGLTRSKTLHSRRNSYDPWGAARTDRYSRAYRYDPWGATRDNSGLIRFADRDWAHQKRYYGDGIGPWQNQRGYNNYYDPYYGSNYQNQYRYNEHNWPDPSYGAPYDRNRYDGSDWRR
ncbi:MAG: hypothetical protein HQL71_15405 [Magnetococcales bacterium]|nr:hypothetical protein [Magnetococcales bacterium]